MNKKHECCKTCKHCYSRDICTFCAINKVEIPRPLLMGGSKKCECYERFVRTTIWFPYPKKPGTRTKNDPITLEKCTVKTLIEYLQTLDQDMSISSLSDFSYNDEGKLEANVTLQRITVTDGCYRTNYSDAECYNIK